MNRRGFRTAHIERRILDPAWGAQDIDVVVDSATHVEVLISGGEQASVEFKRQLPDEDPAGVMKTIAAFANGAGGTILFGVEDDGEIVGVGDDHRRNGRDRLTSLVSDWVRPLANFECEWVEVAGRGVIALHVGRGEHVPYGVGTSDRSARYYIRRAGQHLPGLAGEPHPLAMLLYDQRNRAVSEPLSGQSITAAYTYEHWPVVDACPSHP